MDIEDAKQAIRAGKRATRTAWADDHLDGVWIEMRHPEPGDQWLAHVSMVSVLKTGAIRRVPWDPRIEDVMADDWEVL